MWGDEKCSLFVLVFLYDPVNRIEIALRLPLAPRLGGSVDYIRTVLPGTVPFPLPIRARYERTQDHFHPWRARAQSQGHRPRSAAQQPDRDDRPFRLRQVVARLRHDLCRGAASLCREPVGLCAPVPRNDAEAGCRPDRGPFAGDLDRAEDDVAQSALDGRHRHRDLRLHAPAVCPRRRALFAGHGPADREPDGQPDGRPHPRLPRKARGFTSSRR